MRLVAYFVRHGQAEGNKDNKFKSDGEPLTAEGNKQAEKLGEMFKGRQLSEVHMSPLPRAKQTAKHIMAGRKMRPRVTSDLKALDVGDFAEMKKNDKTINQMAHYQEHTDEKIPGGESIDEFRRRIHPKVLQIIHKGESSGKPAMGVVHASVIRELSRFLNHNEDNAAKIKPGGIVGVFKSPSGYVAKALYRKSNKPDDDRFGS